MSAIKKIHDRHHEIMRMIILGFGNGEIAERVGLSAEQVRNVRLSPIMRKQIEALQTARDIGAINLSQELQEKAVKSYRVLEAIVEDKVRDRAGNEVPVNVSLRANVALKLMSIAGYSPVQKLQAEVINSTVTKDDLDEIKQRAEKARQVSTSEEIQFTEVPMSEAI